MTCERQIAVDETTKSYFKCAESRVSERLNIDEKHILALPPASESFDKSTL